MSTDYRKLYFDNVFNLAASLVIKSTDSALGINKLLNLNGVLESPTTWSSIDPTTWKYYKNLSGEYFLPGIPGGDTLMYIPSIYSTGENVNLLFSKETLTANKEIAQLYQFGTIYYYELVNIYPTQQQLILGILYPADINESIKAVDGSILSYPPNLVEPQEDTLIKELELYIQNHQVRWHIPVFAISDDLYTLAQHGIMYLNIVPKILNLRLKRIKTNEAHSFHIKSFLASNGRLDKYYDYLTLKQALFLYRNLDYINRNNGQSKIFSWLIDKLLTDINIPLVKYKMNHLTNSYDNRYRPNYEFNKIELNPEVNTISLPSLTLTDLLGKEGDLTPGNLDYINDKSVSIDNSIKNSKYGNIDTKVLESALVNYTNDTPYNLTDILINNWAYLSYTGEYTSEILIQLPGDSSFTSFNVQDAFIFFLYNTLIINNVNLPNIPNIVCDRIYRRFNLNNPIVYSNTVNELLTIVDKTVITSDVSANFILNNKPTLSVYLDPGSFYEYCDSLYNNTLLEWYYVSAIESGFQRAYVENMILRTYADIIITYDVSGTSFSSWLNSKSINDSSFTLEDRTSLVTQLFNIATGYSIFNSSSKITLDQIQSAMVNIITYLSSYTIQFLHNFTEVNVRPINWAAIRIQDSNFDLNHSETVVLGDFCKGANTSVSQSRNIEIDHYSSLKPPKQSISSLTNIELSYQFSFGNATETVTPIIINRFLNNVTINGITDESDGTLIVGYDNYYKLTTAQKQSIKSI